MERKFKWMARRSILATSIMWWFLSLLIISMVSVPIFILKYSHENNFDFTILFWIFGIVSGIALLCIILRLIFISTTHLVYGKVVDIEDSSPEDTQVYHNFIIEYTDPYGNKCQTRFYEQFGDNLEDMESQIKEFVSSGRKLLGKKVPVLYKKNKPDRSIVFLSYAE